MRTRLGAFASAILFFALAFFVSCGGKEVLGEPCAPTIDTRELCVAARGEHPEALDFLTDEAADLLGARSETVRFVESPDFSTLGAHTISIWVGDEAVDVTYCVVEDTTPPVLAGVTDRSVLLGEGAILMTGVRAEDECFGSVDVSVDTGTLDTGRVGFYEIVYRAVDASGNEAVQTANVTVYAEEITEQRLAAACDEWLSEVIPSGVTDREQICRLIWAALQERIAYFPVSDKTSRVRAAYLALFLEGRGDCFSYFSAACALFDRVGIEYLTVERTRKAGEERHYWLMVNLAAEDEAPRWYHFDPTKLDTGDVSHDGCLFTDAELDAYNAYRVGFYDYDRAAYPKTDTRSLRAGGGT